ncbi:glycosyl transferase family 1 [Philodulcilactobacillus myokoensis]|uniref:Glycosyl transferase family 1 n=1 Tax=Philodulcilactobacillus myokoensis TaxID=2929573 RepID=A0A9W6B0H8_9LACO|nr:glycosyltransferase [Philodulcilactobacillus myokoensis]GLB46321.1 glycosyl transferase family 1 [Philodulcilactobacillus myokoensis]
MNNNMYYFVNENIFTFNSGTEFSAMNRQKLFNKYDVNSKIMTRNYNQGLHQEIRKNGLGDDDIINMYDYFQHVTKVPYHHVKLRYSKMIDKRYYKIRGIDNNKSMILLHGHKVATVQIFPSTVGEIGNVIYYDDFGNVTSKDIWDARGFKSKTQYMHPDGQLGHELVYDYHGKPVMEIAHMNINGKLSPTMYKLLDYNGHNLRFNTEDDLFVFFMQEILKKHPGVLINDRPTLTEPVAKVNNAEKRYQLLHNVQTTDAKLSGSPKGKLFPILEQFFHKDMNKYDGIIVSTEDQKRDFNKLFPSLRCYAIPDVALFKDHEKEIQKGLKPVDNDNLIYIGRIAEDKHIDHLIQIASFVKNKISDVKLNIVGYFSSPKYQKQLENQVKKLNLNDVVKFKNYSIGKQKAKLLSNSKLMLQTSFGEGLSMNLVEGLEYGLPEVAYDVHYGPNRIIKNDVNGYLIPQGNMQEAANKIVRILSDDDLYKQFSKNSLEHAKDFSADNVMSQWKKLG